MTDRELLRKYAEQGSESAFRSLVGRHVDLVYAISLRGLNDAQAAEEVTQNMFIMLARKCLWLTCLMRACSNPRSGPWISCTNREPLIKTAF